MSNVYLCSDTHFGHRNICKYRPFETALEHDQLVLKNILETVGKRDTLWMLGDNFFSGERMKCFYKILNHVGNLNLVLGNHCTEGLERQRMVYEMAQTNAKIHSMVSYKGCWLTHPPIHPEELRGKFNIHGHTHGHVIDDTRYRCVSMEQINYRPVLFQDILAELKEKNSERSGPAFND